MDFLLRDFDEAVQALWAADFLVVDRRTLALFCRARGISYGRPGRRRKVTDLSAVVQL